jgi:acyl carrier protein
VPALPWDASFEELLRPLLRLLPEDMPITPDLDMIGAGLDSLNVVELLSTIEEHYRITLDDDQFAQSTVATPATLWKAVSAHLDAR